MANYFTLLLIATFFWQLFALQGPVRRRRHFCPIPLSHQFARLDLHREGPIKRGDIVEFQCFAKLLSGRPTSTCLANGRWSVTFPLCVEPGNPKEKYVPNIRRKHSPDLSWFVVVLAALNAPEKCSSSCCTCLDDNDSNKDNIKFCQDGCDVCKEDEPGCICAKDSGAGRRVKRGDPPHPQCYVIPDPDRCDVTCCNCLGSLQSTIPNMKMCQQACDNSCHFMGLNGVGCMCQDYFTKKRRRKRGC